MLQNPCKTSGFKKNMVYKIPPGGGGGGKPYPASGLNILKPPITKQINLRVREIVQSKLQNKAVSE